MAKYATIDAVGVVTAFYDEDIHGTYYQQIPDPNAVASLVDDSDIEVPLVSNGVYNEGATQIPTEAFEISRTTWEVWIANTNGQRWNGTGLEPYVDPIRYSVATLQVEIQNEAENLIAEGTVITPEGQFRTDQASLTRMMGMLKMAELQEETFQTVNITFRTEAGSLVNITSSIDAKGIYLAVSSYVAGILEASANLQESLTTLTEDQLKAFDATDPANWPSGPAPVI